MSSQRPGVKNWKEHTTPFERVQSVATTLAEPRSASYIARHAHVAETTAREHLEQLATLTVLEQTEQDGGGALYSADPLYTRASTMRGLVKKHDRVGLLALKTELQSNIEDWRTNYNAGSPEELRTRAVETDVVSEARELKKIASDWELALYRLSVLDDAIGNYAAIT